ncbi:85/calcium-independent phospholipase A2 [Armadillidium nasatum]|uniref:phospholipase A2 n=1 Tax=Armadillidium nasatum TaxID=96803 RepID=A0A5N5T045_9CRUS|nr:85/calcium-independent phospholipase A2 [Armadillidium nasatum]
MAFLGNLMRSFLSSEGPSGDAVQEVSISNYIRTPVIGREDCLVLYGPTNSKKYDLLLQKTVEDSRTSAFSIFRIDDIAEAQIRFLALKDVLIPFIQVIPQEILLISSLQKTCDVLRQNPTWTVAHIAAHLGYIQAFSHPDIQKKTNTAEIDMRLTPLHLAIQREDLKMIKTIMMLDVSVDATDCKENSIFHTAATTNAKIIELVTSKESKLLNAQNSAGKTPLHLACEADKPDCVKALLISGADDMKNGGTPLHWATSRQMTNALVELGCKINAGNFKGATALHNMVQHDRLPCVVAILSWGAEANRKDKDGNTPIHLVGSPSVLQALLSFGADPSITNNKGENARHSVATRGLKYKNKMVYILHAVGAPRCSTQMATCSDGCSPNRRFNVNLPRGGRALCLDGGGMKGLVLVQLLMVIQREAKVPLKTLFDWIFGTSTGGILALGIAMGKSANYCQGLYFRMKDQVFVGQRPYDQAPLENILKKEFGELTHMADITGVKVVVTGVLADRFPADLHLFRNYEGGEELLHTRNGVFDAPVFEPTKPPNEQLVWEAARCSGAAPSAYGRFIDGGLISNNPTLDMLTEVAEYNAALKALSRVDEIETVNVVNAIDVFRPESLFKTIQMAFGLSNMAKLLIDQATMADNRTVDRARAWCSMCGISYLRLSPQLTIDVQLDETRDDILVNMLWETLVFAQSRIEKIRNVVTLLKANASRLVSENGDIVMIDVD